MWNFSSRAVPPDVSSRCSVALPVCALLASQSPTSAFIFSNASAPLPAAIARPPATPIARIPKTAVAIFFSFIVFSPFFSRLPSSSKLTCLLCRRGSYSTPAKLLGSKPDDETDEHSGQHDVPKKRHARVPHYKQAQKSRDQQTRKQTPRHGAYPRRKQSDQCACDQSLQHGKRDDACHHRCERRLKKSAQAVRQTKCAAHD